MTGVAKEYGPAGLRVRRRWSVSTSFVQWGAARWHLGCAAAGWQLPGPWPAVQGGQAVASSVRVREVADPKCRCPGTGRPRWISETPWGARVIATLGHRRLPRRSDSAVCSRRPGRSRSRCA